MEELAGLGVGVDFTEVDVPLTPVTKDRRFTLDQQAQWAARMVRTCLDVPACESFTFWGFDDAETWMNWLIEPGTDPLLYDAELRPKPMYDAVLHELLAGRGGP